MNKNVPESLKAKKAVAAKAKHCWENATNLMFEDEYFGTATYVEGIVRRPGSDSLDEHGWVERNGKIIDPTLPEMSLLYFPALRWTGIEFERIHFRLSSKPFFRNAEFIVDGQEVEMNNARARARSTQAE